MTIDQVTAVRRFNRFYTNLIGVLRDHQFDSAYSLTEVRVIYELNGGDQVEVADLRRRLNLDAGYLSRILTRLERDGLAVRERSTADARRQRITLTEAGRTLFADLDTRTDAQIRGLLDDIEPHDRARLVTALTTAETILGRKPAPTAYVLRPLAPGDLGWVLQRHGVRYAQDQGWDHTFEAMCARIIADYAEHARPGRDNAWIAELDDRPVGSIFCVHEDDDTARLRLLLVEPEARGHGIGRRLVDECLRHARRLGYRTMVLSTVKGLDQARHIYEKVGFTLAREDTREDFGHTVTHQHWTLTL